MQEACYYSHMLDEASAVVYEVRVENIKSPEDHVEAVLERVEKQYLAATYNIANWTSHEDFLEQIAYKSGRLLKVNSSVLTAVTIECHRNVIDLTVM